MSVQLPQVRRYLAPLFAGPAAAEIAPSAGLGVRYSGIQARSQKVPVRHAGRALAELGVTRADVIKIDTEGAEWEILTALDPALLRGVRVIMGELHGRRDFELLDYLQPHFHIGAKKQLKTRLFNFFAVNRQV